MLLSTRAVRERRILRAPGGVRWALSAPYMSGSTLSANHASTCVRLQPWGKQEEPLVPYLAAADEDLIFFYLVFKAG